MRVYIAIFLCFCGIQVIAQDEPVYSHYMFNSITFNPAYAGNKDYLHAQSTYRMQWIGLEGAPRTLQFNLDAPVYKKTSLGIDLLHDEIGDFSSTKAYGTFAYRIKINAESRLSFGLAAGIDMRRLNNRNGTIDPVLGNINFDLNSFNLRTGIYYSRSNFYIGISSTNLNPNLAYFSTINVPERNYYLTSGYQLKLSDQTVFYPSFLYKDDFNKNAYFNFTGLIGFKSTVWTGLSYKTGFGTFSNLEKSKSSSRVIGIILVLELNDLYRLGYNFDYSISTLQQIDKGSHEVSLSYYFQGKKSNRMLNPRYL